MPQFHLIAPSYQLIKTCGQSNSRRCLASMPTKVPREMCFFANRAIAFVSAQSQDHEAIATVSKTERRLSHIHVAFEIYSIADSGNPKNKII